MKSWTSRSRREQFEQPRLGNSWQTVVSGELNRQGK